MSLPLHELELEPGTRLLDRYTVHDCFDGGGMASIYRAWDERLERTVCIKVLRTTLVEGSGTTSGRALYRATYTHFLKEALSLSKLQHPNTLRIFDFGYLGDSSLPLEDQSPFQVAELLSGGNLDTWVRSQGPLSPSDALDVLEPIAGALAEAHEYGILHRDIKPSNILFADVSGQRIPKLADFGIARSSAPLREGHDATANLTLCSPRWAAPEQLTQGGEGPTTDVYALGLVLHFMLSGRPAFQGGQIRETFPGRITDDSYVTHLVRDARLPRPLEDVLLGCLRLNPTERFRDPMTFARAVRAATLDPRSGMSAPSSSSRNPCPPEPSSGSGTAPHSHSHSHSHSPPHSQSRPLEARVRFVETSERADLGFVTSLGESRLRLSFQPTSDKINVKSLSGFLKRDDARPCAAVLVGEDARIEIVASDRSVRLTTTLMFGSRTAEGIVFVVEGQPVLVPSSRASQAVALFVADTREVVIVARK